MKPGARPKPTKLKQLEGDAHKERWNPHEPKPVVSVPTCPRFLTGAARREWKRIVPELEILGLLTHLDRAALAAYCVNYGRWEKAETKINELQTARPDRVAELHLTSNKNLIISPLLSVANRALEEMHKFLIEFGMTPSSRTRVNGSPMLPDQDPLDKMLGTINN